MSEINQIYRLANYSQPNCSRCSYFSHPDRCSNPKSSISPIHWNYTCKYHSFNEKLTQFRNNVLCRHQSNQDKAIALWKEISTNILETDKMLLYIEWNHYTNGTIDTDTFGEFINQHLQKYTL